jgi:hypothetical protein
MLKTSFCKNSIDPNSHLVPCNLQTPRQAPAPEVQQHHQSFQWHLALAQGPQTWPSQARDYFLFKPSRGSGSATTTIDYSCPNAKSIVQARALVQSVMVNDLETCVSFIDLFFRDCSSKVVTRPSSSTRPPPLTRWSDRAHPT